jgi:hypothetical protein
MPKGKGYPKPKPKPAKPDSVQTMPIKGNKKPKGGKG